MSRSFRSFFRLVSVVRVFSFSLKKFFRVFAFLVRWCVLSHAGLIRAEREYYYALVRLTGLNAKGDSIRNSRKALDKVNFGFKNEGK